MSYDPQNMVSRFLRLGRLNSPVNNTPSMIDPFGVYPPGFAPKNMGRLTPNKINKIQDLPINSSMGTELLDDLGSRQEEFLKRIRKHPAKPDDGKFTLQ